MPKAIAFCRRSTDMQDMSLEDQKTLLANWMQSAPIIQEMGIDQEPVRYIESTTTGTRLGPEFLGLLNEVRRGDNDFQYIVVEKLDRLHGRMGIRLLPILQELSDAGVYVISADNGQIVNRFDNLLSEVYTPLRLAMDREESRKMAQRITERSKIKAAQGWWLGGLPPFGYSRMEVSPEGKEVGILPTGTKSREKHRVRLVLDSPDKVVAVQQVFRMYAYEHGSIKSIATWLNDRGFRTATGNKFSMTVVHEMFRNVLYLGRLIWGRQRVGKFSRDENLWKDTQDSKFHDEDKWITYQNENLRIIEDSLWSEVQARIKSQRHPVYDGPRRKSRYGLLSGILYCCECNSPFYYKEELRKYKSGDKVLYRYRDHARYKLLPCNASSMIHAAPLHEYAESLVLEHISPDIIREAVNQAREILKAEAGIDSQIKGSLGPEIRALEKQRDNLLKYLKDVPYSPSLANELRAIEDQLSQHRAFEGQVADTRVDRLLDQIETVALDFRKLWKQGTAQARQRVARSLIRKVVISEDRSTATWEYYPIPTYACAKPSERALATSAAARPRPSSAT